MSRARQSAATLANPPLPVGGPPPQPPQPSPPGPVDDDMTGTGGIPPTLNPYEVNPNPPTGSLRYLPEDFTLLQVREREIICDFVTKEMMTKKGIIIQYLNSNSTGATTMIGVTRIGLTDPRRVPAFLQRNAAIIRQHAVAALQVHFKMTLCSAGVLEKLVPEDYSISFSWASITEAGRSLTLHGKPDLALGYGLCDQYVQPMLASRNDPHPVCVLNAFVQLQDPARRSTAVIKRAREEAAQKAQGPPPKKHAPNYNNQQYRGPPQINEEQTAERIATKATDILNENLKRAAPVTLGQYFPHLQAGEGPSWPKEGRTPIPDE